MKSGMEKMFSNTWLLLLSHFSCARLSATLYIVAHQAPLSMGFSRQEYWSGLPFPSPMHACMLSHFSCVQLCATLWTAAHQAPLSMGFSRQEYWSQLPFPSPKHIANNRLIFKVYKEHIWLNSKKKKFLLVKGQMTWINIFQRRHFIDIWKECSISLIIREI